MATQDIPFFLNRWIAKLKTKLKTKFLYICYDMLIYHPYFSLLLFKEILGFGKASFTNRNTEALVLLNSLNEC